MNLLIFGGHSRFLVLQEYNKAAVGDGGAGEESCLGEKSVNWSILSSSPFGEFCMLWKGTG